MVHYLAALTGVLVLLAHLSSASVAAPPASVPPRVSAALSGGQLIVTFAPRIPVARAAREITSRRFIILGHIPTLNAYLVRPLSPLSVADARRSLAGVTGVTGAEPNRPRRIPAYVSGISGPAADPRAEAQWHLTVIGETVTPAPRSAGPTIAVIDTGVDYTHPDLAGQVINVRTGPINNFINGNNDPMDDHGHGTHVAGVAAALAGNGFLGRGVSPTSKILAVKALDSRGNGSCWDVARGIEYARTYRPDPKVAPPVRVINLSLGDRRGCKAERMALRRAVRDGILVVAAAGNQNSTRPFYPAAYPEAIAVAATGVRDCRTYFSNYGRDGDAWVKLAAPGYDIRSLAPGGGFVSIHGTSAATPIVAGAVARAWAEDPTRPAARLQRALLASGPRAPCGFFAGATPRRLDLPALLGQKPSRLTGSVLNATGAWPLPGATVRLLTLTGEEVARAQTDLSGLFVLEGAPPGRYALRITRPGFAPLERRVSLPRRRLLEEALAPARPSGQWTIVLHWRASQPFDMGSRVTGTGSAELDAVLGLPGGDYVWSGNRGSLPGARLMHDSLTDVAPLETIVISQRDPGRHSFGVLRPFRTSEVAAWGTLGDSGAIVRVYRGRQLVRSFGVPPACGIRTWWYVFDIEGTRIVRRGSCHGDAPPVLDPPFVADR